jgi:antitoxin component YwqK of YwqJK toxin-antitoxin module
MFLALIAAGLLPLLPISQIQGQKKSDSERGDLNGPVHSVRTEEALFGGRRGHCSQDPKRLAKVTTYDREGGLLEYTDYNLDGSIHSKVTFGRDQSGNKTEEAYYDGKGRLYHKRFFRPGPDSRLIKEESYAPKGSLIARTLPSYSDTGVLNQLDTYDGEGILVQTRIYDAAGNLTEESHYENGGLSIKSVGAYDANGNKIEESHYKADGSLYSDSTMNPAKIMDSYDSGGRLSQQLLYSGDGSISWRINYAYDSKGNLVEQWQYRLGGFLISHRTYAYEFDSAGNWAKQTITDRLSETCSNPMEIIYRTITYY